MKKPSSTPKRRPKCPMCKEEVVERDHAPFCSDRCKMSDLARWLHGEYAIPSFGGPGIEDWPEDSGY